VKYERKVSRDAGSEDQILLSLLGSGNRVLELGCHSGHFSAAAMKNGNKVVGLDIDGEAVRCARARGVEASVVDLDAPGSLPVEAAFDVVLMSNILEHLTDPGRVLREAHAAIRPDGRLLVSVPNVAHFRLRLALLRGRFDYADAGPMDRTHLRFFTRESLREMLEAQGWRVVRERFSPGLVASRLRGRALRVLARRAPGAFSMHLIAEARSEPRPAGRLP
jgi:2-polyprenyl-3-methyl-5-hydroxy-6-metoxy-1,4-benzoquinol methylase